MTESVTDSSTPKLSSTGDVKEGNGKRKIQQCSKCNRLARKKCSQQACAQCCTDDQCEGHQQFRLRESIINGTHPIQITAKKQRALAVHSNTFREKAFKYMGETVLIWRFDEFMNNPKWKEESIRKLRKLKTNVIVRNGKTSVNDVQKKQLNKDVPISEGRKKNRFHRVMQHLYQKSIE